MPNKVKSPLGQPRSDLFYRSYEIAERAFDEEAGTVTFTASSETPVQRFYGQEILSHADGAMDFSHATAVLAGHNREKIIGPLIDPVVDGSKSRASNTFDDTQVGRDALVQVKSGSLRGVSIGYIPHFKELAVGEEFALSGGRKIKGLHPDKGGPTFVSEKTEVVEVSFTPTPADNSVGIGREATRDLEGIEIKRPQADLPGLDDNKTKTKGGTEMTEKEVQTKVDEAVLTALAGRDKEHAATQDSDTATREAELKGVHDRAAVVGQEALAFRLMAEGKTPEQITDAIIEAVGKERGKPGDGGGDDRDADGNSATAIESVPEDEFLRSLTHAGAVSLD